MWGAAFTRSVKLPCSPPHFFSIFREKAANFPSRVLCTDCKWNRKVSPFSCVCNMDTNVFFRCMHLLWKEQDRDEGKGSRSLLCQCKPRQWRNMRIAAGCTEKSRSSPLPDQNVHSSQQLTQLVWAASSEEKTWWKFRYSYYILLFQRDLSKIFFPVPLSLDFASCMCCLAQQE